MSDSSQNNNSCNQTKRDLIKNTAYVTAGVGVVCAFLPFIDSMNPSQDVQALASIEVDISPIKQGEEKKVMWRGKPIFIKHRTPEEIKQLMSEVIHKQIYRLKKKEKTEEKEAPTREKSATSTH